MLHLRHRNLAFERNSLNSAMWLDTNLSFWRRDTSCVNLGGGVVFIDFGVHNTCRQFTFIVVKFQCVQYGFYCLWRGIKTSLNPKNFTAPQPPPFWKYWEWQRSGRLVVVVLGLLEVWVYLGVIILSHVA